MTKALKSYNPDYEAAVRASFLRQGLMGTIGAWLVEIAPGVVTIEVPHAKKITQQQGFFHGGVAGAIADNAGGYAAMSLMPAGSEVLTVEYKINFIRPASGALMRARGEVIRAGKTLLIARIDVLCGTSESLDVCGIAQATYMRLDVAA